MSAFEELESIAGLTCIPNEQLLLETKSRANVCTLSQHQSRLRGHMSRFLEVNPAHPGCFSSKGISLDGGGQWVDYRACSLVKSRNPVGMYLEYERGQHVDYLDP